VRMIGSLLWPLAKTLVSSARQSWAERRARTAEQAATPKGSLWKLAPPTPFNVSITNQRAFAGLTLPLDEAKRIGKAHGASVNDVVLWLCSTALRSYLTESRELPAKSLVAGVPVSLRAEGDTRMNNQVTMSLVDLATDEKDGLARLRRIREATASMKTTMGAFGELIPTDFPSLGAPWLLSGLASLYGRSGLADRIRMANVAISNVPGSPLPLYLAGAKMLDYYPVSIAAHGVALNITVQSYMGQLCFGLIACRRAVPDVRDIALAMQRAFEAFGRLPLPEAAAAAPVAALEAARTAPRSPRKPAARPSAAKVPAKTRPELRVVTKTPLRARTGRQAKVAG
jgi:diacylglycerol O-acyltransferase / wax synthase